MDRDYKIHWNKVYSRNDYEKLGWYEDFPEQSLKLIESCKLSRKARILNVGSGTSTLIDALLEKGYENLIASDLSEEALTVLKNRLGSNSEKVEYIIDDLTQPSKLNNIGPVDLWHDRAVLHFFTDVEQRKAYIDLMYKLVKKNGFVIIASFDLDTADKCSGLPVYRYNVKMLQNLLGCDFNLLNHFNFEYIMPSGDKRNYIYTRFIRL